MFYNVNSSHTDGGLEFEVGVIVKECGLSNQYELQ